MTSSKDKKPENYQAPKNIKEFIERYDKGERYFANSDFINGNLRGKEFENINLDNSNLSRLKINDSKFIGVSFRYVVLNDSIIDESEFSLCDLSHSSLINGEISKSKIIQSNLKNSNVTGLLINLSNIHESNFSGIFDDQGKQASQTAVGIKLLKGVADFTNGFLRAMGSSKRLTVKIKKSNLTNVIMENIKISPISIEESRIDRSNLSDSYLDGATFKTVTFLGTNLTGCSIKYANIDNCDFENATLNYSTLNETVVKKSKFINSKMSKIDFENAKILCCDLYNAAMISPKFDPIMMYGSWANFSTIESSKWSDEDAVKYWSLGLRIEDTKDNLKKLIDEKIILMNIPNDDFWEPLNQMLEDFAKNNINTFDLKKFDELLSLQETNIPIDAISYWLTQLKTVNSKFSWLVTVKDKWIIEFNKIPDMELKENQELIYHDVIFLERIKFQNFSAFNQLEIEWPTDKNNSDRGQWTIFIGDNGVGKTNLLRGLVLLLIDEDQCTSILSNYKKSIIHNENELSNINLMSNKFLCKLTLSREKENDVSINTSISDKGNVFVCAYGSQRGSALGGSKRELNFLPLNRIATLFNESKELIHAETWLITQKSIFDEDSTDKTYSIVTKNLCRILPGVTSIDVSKGSAWVLIENQKISFNSLSDGYLTTVGWIIDLIARWIDYAKLHDIEIESDFLSQMNGFVLIDEIDLHLHPKWQLQIITNIREIFPKMSFVVTTHNPLALRGARDGEIFVLRRNDNSIIANQVNIPHGYRVDDLLTGIWFELASTIDLSTLELINTYQKLVKQEFLNDTQKQQVERIRNDLKKSLNSFTDTSIERMALNIAAELVDENYQQKSTEERNEIRKKIKDKLREKIQAKKGQKND